MTKKRSSQSGTRKAWRRKHSASSDWKRLPVPKPLKNLTDLRKMSQRTLTLTHKPGERTPTSHRLPQILVSTKGASDKTTIKSTASTMEAKNIPNHAFNTNGRSLRSLLPSAQLVRESALEVLAVESVQKRARGTTGGLDWVIGQQPHSVVDGSKHDQEEALTYLGRITSKSTLEQKLKRNCRDNTSLTRASHAALSSQSHMA